MSIIIKGLKVYENGDKNKQPIIFIHGFPYNSSMWEDQIVLWNELKLKNPRCIKKF